MKTIEYRVRPVTRFVVTRYTEDIVRRTGGLETLGEFDSEQYASDVVQALQSAPDMPRKFAIVQRGFDSTTRAFYAETPQEAEQLKADAEKQFGEEFRIFSSPA